MKEFKRATIEAAENGFEVEIQVKISKPSRKDIAEMDKPQVAYCGEDYVTDYKKYVAKDIDDCIAIIKQASEDKEITMEDNDNDEQQ